MLGRVVVWTCFTAAGGVLTVMNITITAKGEAVSSASGFLVAAINRAVADSGKDDASVCIETDK